MNLLIVDVRIIIAINRKIQVKGLFNARQSNFIHYRYGNLWTHQCIPPHHPSGALDIHHHASIYQCIYTYFSTKSQVELSTVVI